MTSTDLNVSSIHTVLSVIKINNTKDDLSIYISGQPVPIHDDLSLISYVHSLMCYKDLHEAINP